MYSFFTRNDRITERMLVTTTTKMTRFVRANMDAPTRHMRQLNKFMQEEYRNGQCPPDGSAPEYIPPKKNGNRKTKIRKVICE